MKAVIFYYSISPGEDRYEWTLGYDQINECYTKCYIRTEIVEAGDLSDALDRATPQDDESVMNSHWIEGNGLEAL